MRQNSCGTVNIVKTDCDPKISTVPELIGNHPGAIAPVTLATINQWSRTAGMMAGHAWLWPHTIFGGDGARSST